MIFQIVAAVAIVCGALGGAVPVNAIGHEGVWWRGPLTCKHQAIVGPVDAIKNVAIFNSSKRKNSRLASFDRLDCPSGGLLFHAAIGRDDAARRNGGEIVRLKFCGSRHFLLVTDRPNTDFTPVGNSMGRCRAGVFNYDKNSDPSFQQVGREMRAIAHVNSINKEVSPQLPSRRFSGFNQRPKQQNGADNCRPKRDDGKAQIETGHPVGFGNLLDRSPLSAKVCIFFAIRVFAIGLIGLGYRLSSHRFLEARMTGGLIAVVGAALLAGIVELVGYG